MNSQAADGQLKALTERRERLEAEKQDAADAIKDLNGEVKSLGYDLTTFNTVIKRRKRNRDEVAGEDAMIEMYEAVLEGK